jgi:hypothetical protein
MPLHPDDERWRGPRPLERAVGRPRRLDETVCRRARVPDGGATSRAASTHDVTEPRSVLDLDRMDGELARHLLVNVVPDLFGKMLDQISPTRDVQELEPLQIASVGMSRSKRAQ